LKNKNCKGVGHFANPILVLPDFLANGILDTNPTLTIFSVFHFLPRMGWGFSPSKKVQKALCFGMEVLKVFFVPPAARVGQVQRSGSLLRFPGGLAAWWLGVHGRRVALVAVLARLPDPAALVAWCALVASCLVFASAAPRPGGAPGFWFFLFCLFLLLT
jgi:hypothetical protein